MSLGWAVSGYALGPGRGRGRPIMPSVKCLTRQCQSSNQWPMSGWATWPVMFQSWKRHPNDGKLAPNTVTSKGLVRTMSGEAQMCPSEACSGRRPRHPNEGYQIPLDENLGTVSIIHTSWLSDGGLSTLSHWLVPHYRPFSSNADFSLVP